MITEAFVRVYVTLGVVNNHAIMPFLLSSASTKLGRMRGDERGGPRKFMEIFAGECGKRPCHAKEHWHRLSREHKPGAEQRLANKTKEKKSAKKSDCYRCTMRDCTNPTHYHFDREKEVHVGLETDDYVDIEDIYVRTEPEAKINTLKRPDDESEVVEDQSESTSWETLADGVSNQDTVSTCTMEPALKRPDDESEDADSCFSASESNPGDWKVVESRRSKNYRAKKLGAVVMTAEQVQLRAGQLRMDSRDWALAGQFIDCTEFDQEQRELGNFLWEDALSEQMARGDEYYRDIDVFCQGMKVLAWQCNRELFERREDDSINESDDEMPDSVGESDSEDEGVYETSTEHSGTALGFFEAPNDARAASTSTEDNDTIASVRSQEHWLWEKDSENQNSEPEDYPWDELTSADSKDSLLSVAWSNGSLDSRRGAESLASTGDTVSSAAPLKPDDIKRFSDVIGKPATSTGVRVRNCAVQARKKLTVRNLRKIEGKKEFARRKKLESVPEETDPSEESSESGSSDSGSICGSDGFIKEPERFEYRDEIIRETVMFNEETLRGPVPWADTFLERTGQVWDKVLRRLFFSKGNYIMPEHDGHDIFRRVKEVKYSKRYKVGWIAWLATAGHASDTRRHKSVKADFLRSMYTHYRECEIYKELANKLISRLLSSNVHTNSGEWYMYIFPKAWSEVRIIGGQYDRIENLSTVLNTVMYVLNQLVIKSGHEPSLVNVRMKEIKEGIAMGTQSTLRTLDFR